MKGMRKKEVLSVCFQSKTEGAWSNMDPGRQGGSITLFLTLILTLIFSFLFSLLEAARVQGLDQFAQRAVLLEMESAFGEYQAQLWEDYRLLFLDGGNSDGELELALLEGRRMEHSVLQKKGNGFFQLALRSMEIPEYTLATDYGGAAFERQAVRAIQEQLTVAAAEALKTKLDQGGKMAEQGKELDLQWESAKNAMDEAKDIKTESEGSETDSDESRDNPNSNKEDVRGKGGQGSKSSATPQEQRDSPNQKDLPENPIDSVELLKTSAILSLVVENPAEVSAKGIVLQETVGQRKLSLGNQEPIKGGIVDKLWFLQYLDTYFSCGTGAGKKGGEEHALDYELEYCVAGKSTDQENLEKTVKELLLIREVGNFATIMQDGKKQALAMEVATAAVGFTGIPPLIQAVQIGILLAWSYIESILDVRCLLSGGKIPLIKKVTHWKSDISIAEEVLQEKKEKTDSHEEGMDYREYLQLLLLLTKEETLIYRAMDVIEQNLRLKQPAFRMDHQLHGGMLEGVYSAKPLFLSLIPITKHKAGDYHFRKSCKGAYLE